MTEKHEITIKLFAENVKTVEEAVEYVEKYKLGLVFPSVCIDYGF